MTDDRAKLLASILRGIEQLEMEKAEFLTEWKDRNEKLHNAARKLKDDILSGQSDLFVKGATDEHTSGNSVGNGGELGLEKSGAEARGASG